MRVLLNAPWKYNLSVMNVECLATVVVSVLKHERGKQTLFDGHQTNFCRLMTFFLNTYDTETSNAASTDPKGVQSHPQSAEEISILRALRIEIIQTFVVIAQLRINFTKFRPDLPTIIGWMQGPEPQIQICANLFIGNLFYSQPELRRELARHPRLTSHLFQCLYFCRDRETLTSALDLLNNLASDTEGRLSLGKSMILDALFHCQLQDNIDFQIRQKAFYHMRQLLKGCLPNVYRLLRTTGSGRQIKQERESTLTSLLVLFRKSQELTIKVEIGRTIAEAWRTLHSSSLAPEVRAHAKDPIEDLKVEHEARQSVEDEISPSLIALTVRESFINHPQITEPILVLIQSSNAALMTEGWLVMAFMSMWREGAQAVYDAVSADGTMEIFRTVLQSPDLQSKDKANARYLVAELQNQLVSNASIWPMPSADTPRPTTPCVWRG